MKTTLQTTALICAFAILIAWPAFLVVKSLLITLIRKLAPLELRFLKEFQPELEAIEATQLIGDSALEQGNSTNDTESSKKNALGISDLGNSKHYIFPVCYASERSIQNPFRLIPWDYRGILRFDGQDFHFSGIRKKGIFRTRMKHLKLKFPRNKVRIAYIAPSTFEVSFGANLGTSGLKWIRVEAHNRSFFFSASPRPSTKKLSNNSLPIYPKVHSSSSTHELYMLISETELNFIEKDSAALAA